jgi:uncharacterized protein (TIGR02266 family)
MRDAKTILVVDDVSMFRELASVFLARTAHVITAATGTQALEILRTRRVDLVVTDLNMPGLDGTELCRTIKTDSDLRDLPVVIMLRGDNEKDSQRAVRAGADDMLCKPLSREALIQTVNHFLESGLSRGLPRIDVATPIWLRSPLLQSHGTTRNISRGGLLVETDYDFIPKTELELDFVLPTGQRSMKPLAQVVWCEESEDRRLAAVGLRFLSIDAATMRDLDDFIVHNAPVSLELGSASAGENA